LATAEAHAGRAPARHRAGSAPGLVRMLRGSIVPVAHITGTGSGLVSPLSLSWVRLSGGGGAATFSIKLSAIFT
jgi:hypothetical protein